MSGSECKPGRAQPVIRKYQLRLAGGPDANKGVGGPGIAIQEGREAVYQLRLAGGPDANNED